MADTINGKVVWHDLSTNDVDAAAKFYSELVGWTFTDLDMGELGKYKMIKAGDKDIGGIINPEDYKGSFWLGYISSEDVDAAVERAKQMGGKLLYGPVDVPNEGRFAIIADAQDAVFAVYKSVNPIPEDAEPKVGEFCWDELMTTDPEAAKGFYKEIFNWDYREMEMSGAETYTICKRGDVEAGGLMKLPPNVPAPPHWMAYILVSDLDATTKRVAELGGNVLLQPTDVPDMGRFSVIQDPTGGVISLWFKL